MLNRFFMNSAAISPTVSHFPLFLIPHQTIPLVYTYTHTLPLSRRLTFSTTLCPLSFMVILSHQAGHLHQRQRDLNTHTHTERIQKRKDFLLNSTGIPKRLKEHYREQEMVY